MPLRKSFTIKDVQTHVDHRYGRYASADSLRRSASKLFGATRAGVEKQLTPKQAAQLVNHLIANSKKLTVSDRKKNEIEQLLLLRSKEGTYGKEFLASIAKKVSHPKSPISEKLVKQMNSPFFKQMKREGRLTKTTFSPERKQTLEKMRAFLAANINATEQEVFSHLGFKTRANLQRVLANLGSDFSKERSLARIEAIKKFDQQTGQALTIKEIAQKLGLNEKYVSANIKRGKVTGAKNRDERRAKKFLFLLGYFTTPEKGVLSAERISKIVQTEKRFAIGILEKMRKQGLVYEVDHLGSRMYSISPKGFRTLNGIGRDTKYRLETLAKMDLNELEETLQLLKNASREGLSAEVNEMKLIEQIVERKRTEEFARKNNSPKNLLPL